MKTQEELNALKEEVKTVNKKLAELTEEELAEVTGAWGTENVPGSWQDPDGKTSGIIKDENITWLYEKSFDHVEGTSAWYGLNDPIKESQR